ncbi:MAG: NUDIX hydrolase [Vicinamibacterales bacterium]
MTVDASRRHPARPILCVGAVIVDSGRVVMVRRGQPPLMGAWSVPGGVVELGETLEAAVAREALEETGLAVEIGPVLKVLERIHHDLDGRIEYHYVIVDYLCRASGGTLACASDAADAKWVDETELAALRPSPEVSEVVARALALAAGD